MAAGADVVGGERRRRPRRRSCRFRDGGGGGVGGASEQATRPRGRPEIRPVGPEEQPLASTRASASELDPGGQHCPARPAPG